MTEAALGEVVVEDLDDELGRERLPLLGALGRPARGTAGRAAREPGRLLERLDLREELDCFSCVVKPEVNPTWCRRPSSS